MDSAWESEFRTRMGSFKLQRPPREGEVSVSMKVRVVSGCFHREHSPHAYTLIDQNLASIASKETEFAFVEHESGPELLVYISAGVALATSVINLIIAIIKARSDGIKKGDRPSDPVEIIVRSVGDGDKYVEEHILRVGHRDPVNRGEIAARINEALKRLLRDKGAKAATRSAQRATGKRRAANRKH